MSRIGRQPITIPAGVSASIAEGEIIVKGPKGKLNFPIHPQIKVKIKDNLLVVSRLRESKLAKSVHGTARAVINNLIIGVTEGFQKRLELVGTGYRAAPKGAGLSLTLGYSHPVIIDPVPGITFELEGNTAITVRGIDKELVGQAAANIRASRPPEPYKGKGIRYRGEVVRRKAGKQAKAVATA